MYTLHIFTHLYTSLGFDSMLGLIWVVFFAFLKMEFRRFFCICIYMCLIYCLMLFVMFSLILCAGTASSWRSCCESKRPLDKRSLGCCQKSHWDDKCRRRRITRTSSSFRERSQRPLTQLRNAQDANDIDFFNMAPMAKNSFSWSSHSIQEGNALSEFTKPCVRYLEWWTVRIATKACKSYTCWCKRIGGTKHAESTKKPERSLC